MAREEFAIAFLFYEDQLIGLGDRFESEFERTVNQIASNPFLFQRKYKHYREALVKGFPYSLIYEIVGNTVVVHAVFHAKQNPSKKLKKKKKS